MPCQPLKKKRHEGKGLRQKAIQSPIDRAGELDLFSTWECRQGCPVKTLENRKIGSKTESNPACVVYAAICIIDVSHNNGRWSGPVANNGAGHIPVQADIPDPQAWL